MLVEINEFLLQERSVSIVTTEDEKEARYLIIKILISNWPRTRKFSQFFKKQESPKGDF